MKVGTEGIANEFKLTALPSVSIAPSAGRERNGTWAETTLMILRVTVASPKTRSI
jgi:hypothetical protein